MAGGFTPCDAAALAPGSTVWRTASVALYRLQENCGEAASPACDALRGKPLGAILTAHSQVVAGINYKMQCGVGDVLLTLLVFEQRWSRTLELVTASVHSQNGDDLGLVLDPLRLDLSGANTRYTAADLHVPGLSASVFLPPLTGHAARRGVLEPYYISSRFDWGSMVGDVRITSADDGAAHTLLGSSDWRWPHDPTWTEAGVGLASEFGCGEDGVRCAGGWGAYEAGSLNGVLGYDEAAAGESFLKIGVGALVKGSCPGCNATDPADLYRFNRPYQLAERPDWQLVGVSKTSVSLRHSATLRGWGYRIERTVRMSAREDGERGGELTMETVLANTGTHAFSTPFYSHNLYTIDSQPSGPPWAVHLDMAAPQRYSSAAWGSAVEEFFRLDADGTFIATSSVSEDVLMKATFLGDSNNTQSSRNGSFTMEHGDVRISSSLGGTSEGEALYSYAMYVERDIISPEPARMISVAPGESVSWVQRTSFALESALAAEEAHAQSHKGWVARMLLCVCIVALVSPAFLKRRRQINELAARGANSLQSSLLATPQGSDEDAPYVKFPGTPILTGSSKSEAEGRA